MSDGHPGPPAEHVSPGGALWEAFADIDATASTSDTIGYLDAMRALGPVAEGKRRALELLGVGPGDRVLDVGCGDGLDTIAVAGLVAPGGEAVGVDPSATVVEVARGHARHRSAAARFEQGDAQALDFPDGGFDAVLCDRTLQHVADPETALREMARVTRAGGSVVVSETLVDVKGHEGIDASAAEPVVRGLIAPARGQAWMGLMAPLVFRRAGLALEHVEDVVGTVGDAAGVFVVCGLRPDGRPRARQSGYDEADLAAFGTLVREQAGRHLWAEVRTALFVGRPS